MRQKNQLQCSFRRLSVLFFHLLLAHSRAGQSQLIAPSQPIVATVGDDIILPCHLKPEADVVAMTLEWTRPDLNDTLVHVRRASQDVARIQHPSYKGRTSVSIDELKHGNVSLKLSKVKPSDGGRYKCHIPKLDTESVIELIVGAASSPSISLSGLDLNKRGVVLQCESRGWYPEPEVFWLDGEGNLLSAGPTETVRGPDDLYTVSSRVTVEKRHSNSFTCRVQQNSTNQTRETLVHVPDDFFEVQSSSSSTTVGLAVSLAVCILVVLILGFFVWKYKTKRSSKRQKTQVDGVTEEQKEGQQLMTRNKGREERKTENSKWPLFTKKRFKEEKQKLKEEKNMLKEEQQKLKEEKKRREEAEQEVQRKNQELQEKTVEIGNKDETIRKERRDKEEAQSEVRMLKDQLESKNKELREEKKKLQANIQEMEEHPDETIRKLQQERRDKEKAQSEVMMLNDQLESKNKEVDGLKDEVNKLTEEKKRSERERQKWENKFKEEKKKRERAEEEVKELKTEVDDLNTKVKTLTEEKTKSEEERQKLQSNITDLEKQLNDEKKSGSSLSSQVVSLTADNNKLTEEKKRSEKERQKLQTKITEWEKNFKEEEKKRERAEEEVKELQTEFNYKQAEVEQLQKEIKKMESGLQSLMEDLQSDTLEISLTSQAGRRSAGSVQTFPLSGGATTSQVQSGPVQSVPLSKWPEVLRQKIWEKLQKKITEQDSEEQEDHSHIQDPQVDINNINAAKW